MGWIQLNEAATAAQAAGTLMLSGETELHQSAGSRIADLPVIEKEWAPSNGEKIQTNMAIVLENVAMGYKKPNILDVKLGARLWADDAPLAKRAKLDKVAEESTSKPLGFRIAGMKTFQGLNNLAQASVTPDGYRLYDKWYGRSFNADNVLRGFREYFHLSHEEKPRAPMRKVIRRFIKNLEDMLEILKHEESRMYSASLLFVYEGDQLALEDAFFVEEEMINAIKAQQAETNNGDYHSDAENSEDNNRDGAADDAGTNGHDEVDEVDENIADERPKFPAIQSLKLIDFAHARWTPGLGPDENTLHGIRNVIKLLRALLG